jgi:hypothetical protein
MAALRLLFSSQSPISSGAQGPRQGTSRRCLTGPKKYAGLTYENGDRAENASECYAPDHLGDRFRIAVTVRFDLWIAAI